MVLVKPNVDIRLQGLDTKTDAKLTAPGKMLALENARFQKTGRISKRLGSELKSQLATDYHKRLFGFGGAIQSVKTAGGKGAVTIDVFDNAPALATPTGQALDQTMLACPAAWVQEAVSVGVLGAAGSTITSADAAVIGTSSIVYVYVADGLGASYLVRDPATGAVLRSGTIDASAVEVRILAVPEPAGRECVFAVRLGTGDIKIYHGNLLGTNIGAIVLKATLSAVAAAATTAVWDWAIIAGAPASEQSFILVASKDPGTATKCNLNVVETFGWGVSTGSLTSTGAINGIGVGGGASDFAVFVDQPKMSRVDTSATVTASHAGVGTGWWGLVYARAAVYVGADDFVTVVASASATPALDVMRYDASGSQITRVGYPIYGAKLVSKIGIVANGNDMPIVMASWAFGAESSYFMFGVDFANGGNLQLQAQLAHDHAILQASANSTLPNMCVDPGSSLLLFCPQVYQTDVIAGLGTSPGAYAAQAIACYFDFDPTHGWDAVEVESGALVTGGYLQQFDGSRLIENGYLLYPIIISASQAAGGGLADGDYELIAVYERTDALGNMHRSALSPPFKKTVSAGGSTAKITVHVKPYPLHRIGNDQIQIYVAPPGSTTFYRVSQASAINNPLTSTDAAIDCLSASTSAPLLYTMGGEAENYQPQCPTAIAADGDYVYVVTGMDRLRLQVSKPALKEYGMAFFPDLSKACTMDEGPISALARQDGRLFIFKNRGVYFAAGDGPDLTGANDSLGNPQRLFVELGAKRQRSVLATDAGIFADGQKGIWLIGRDMSKSYVGDAVEDYNGTELVDGCLHPDRDEVHLLLADGSELVFNTFFGTWSTNPTLNALAIAHAAGVRHLAAVDLAGGGAFSSIYGEGGYADQQNATTAYALRLLTGWIKLGAIQGYARVRDVFVLGNLKSDHTLQVRLAFDNEASFTETKTISSADATSGGSAYQARFHLRRQKCEALQLEIMDTEITGEDFDISGLMLRAGLKDTGMKLPTAKGV